MRAVRRAANQSRALSERPSRGRDVAPGPPLSWTRFGGPREAHRRGQRVQLGVRLSVLVLVLRLLGLPAALLPHHRLLVVLAPVQAGPLVHAHAPHHLPADSRGRQRAVRTQSTTCAQTPAWLSARYTLSFPSLPFYIFLHPPLITVFPSLYLSGPSSLSRSLSPFLPFPVTPVGCVYRFLSLTFPPSLSLTHSYSLPL